MTSSAEPTTFPSEAAYQTIGSLWPTRARGR